MCARIVRSVNPRNIARLYLLMASGYKWLTGKYYSVRLLAIFLQVFKHRTLAYLDTLMSMDNLAFMERTWLR